MKSEYKGEYNTTTGHEGEKGIQGGTHPPIEHGHALVHDELLKNEGGREREKELERGLESFSAFLDLFSSCLSSRRKGKV
jgi:hypothetical protein